MKDISKFRRGQVWFVRENIETKGAIQNKARPFVIVSNNTCNRVSPVIHMAPITSKLKKKLPTHVIYQDEDHHNTILLEQIIPKSVPHVAKNARYMYTLSEGIMELVDQAILLQFSLTKRDDMKEKFIESGIYKEGLDELASLSEEIEEEEEDRLVDSQINKFNTRLEKYKSINNITHSIEIDRTEGGRIRWSSELKEQLIRDSDILSEEEILEKYRLKSSSYKSVLSKFRRELYK